MFMYEYVIIHYSNTIRGHDTIYRDLCKPIFRVIYQRGTNKIPNNIWEDNTLVFIYVCVCNKFLLSVVKGNISEYLANEYIYNNSGVIVT